MKLVGFFIGILFERSMSMRLTIVFTCLILLLSSATKKPGNKDFTILKAEKQTFYGGVAGSGITTTYMLELKALRKMNMKCDSAWAEGKRETFLLPSDSSTGLQIRRIKKGETIKIRIQFRTAVEMGGGDYQIHIPGSTEAKPPIDVKNGLVLKYSGGKSKYLIIKDVKTLDPVFAP